MKNILQLFVFFTIGVFAGTGLNFKGCSGAGTFEQKINHYHDDYENAIKVGEIPKGLQGLDINLISDKDVDIRLYGADNDKIVHWPKGILKHAIKETKAYHGVDITYSGYNGTHGHKGHEYIQIAGTTPTAMTMKAFGYRAGYATVNYSWTGKEGCQPKTSGSGNFTQYIARRKTTLVGTIPPKISDVEIMLKSDKDLDIQLYGKDGTAIVSWSPKGLLSGPKKQTITYKGMNITWSGYNGVNGHKGHEYIKIKGMTTEMLVMKVYGYQAGNVNVTYTWGKKTQFQLGKWIRTSPGAGGAFSMIGATASGMLVAGSDLSGVYISKDKGNSWKALGENSGLLDTSVQVLGFDPSHGNTFYVGTTSGIFRTTDGGIHFSSITPDTTFPKDNGMLIESIATSKNKIYITYHTWTNKNSPSQVSVGTIANNGDISWRVLPSFGMSPLQIIKLLVNPLDPTIVYALSGNSRYGCTPARAYKLQYRGGVASSWVDISTDIISRERTRHSVDVNTTIGILDIEMDESNKNGYYLSTFNPQMCPYELDARLVEEQVAMWDYVHDDNIGNIYHYDGSSAQALSDDTGRTGILVNTQGKTRVMNILKFEETWDSPNDTVATWEYTNHTWNRLDDMAHWEIGPNSNPNYSFGFSYYGLNKTLTKDQFNPNHIYGTYGFNGVSFDGGKTFKRISTKQKANNTWRSTGLDNIVGTAIEPSDANKKIVYMGGTDIGFWYSKNHGESWKMSLPSEEIYKKYIWWQAFDNSAYANPGGSNVDTLISDPEIENKIWSTFSAAQSYGVVKVKNGVRTEFTGLFKSDNYGENWRLITGGDMPEDGRMYGLSIDKRSPKNNRTLYMTVNGHVFKSVDDGENWQQKTPSGSNGICGLNVMPVKAGTENGCGLKMTAIDAQNSNLVYAGGESGLWKSTNGGGQWTRIGGSQMEANRHRAFNMNRDISPTYNAHQDDDSLPYAWEGIFDIRTDPSIANRVYVTVFAAGNTDKGGLYRSDDAGNSWKKITLPSLHGVNPDRYLRGIAIDPHHSNIIFVSSSEAYHSGGHAKTSVGILYSTDAGSTWHFANKNMAWNYGGMMKIENTTENPRIWAWSQGTGLQYNEMQK